MAEMAGLDVVWALGLGLVCLGLLALWRTNLAGSLLLAYARALLQLIVLAYAIALGISLNSPGATIGLLLLLTTVHTILLANRIEAGDRSWLPICAGALLLGVGLPLAYSILVVLRPTSWFMPQLWLPLAALALATASQVAGTAGEQLLRSLQQQAPSIETRLSLGATPAAAIAQDRIAALRSALLPLISSTAVAGLAGLSAFMAGLVFAGMDPLQAVIYDLLLLLVTLASAIGTALLVTIGVESRCFNRLGQFTRQ
jgi:putative ABC transport system permease protein